MARMKKKKDLSAQIPIAPMIDIVFLLLIYFMVSATIKPQEADISFQLPGTVEQTDPVDMPDEQIIELTQDGQVIVNEYPYDKPEAERFLQLAGMLSRFKQAADANKSEALVTVSPADGTNHLYIVKVMDAISMAGIEAVNFAIGDE